MAKSYLNGSLFYIHAQTLMQTYSDILRSTANSSCSLPCSLPCLPCLSQFFYFCLAISEEHSNLRLRGVKLIDGRVYFVVYDFINILLGLEFETTNTRKIYLRLQDKLGTSFGESCETLELQFCGSKVHKYPCMTLKNLSILQQHLEAKTNEIDVVVKMFFEKTMMDGVDGCCGIDVLLERCCGSVVRANLHLGIDQAAAEEKDNFNEKTNYVVISGLLVGGKYMFHLDECLLYLKAYAKCSSKAKSFCQRLRSEKYSISKEYEKILKIADKPLDNVSIFQSSSSYISSENVLILIEMSQKTPNLNARCNHAILLSHAIKQLESQTIRFV